MTFPTTKDGLLIRDFYLDESSQTQAQYLVLGGVTIRADAVAAFESALTLARLPELPHGEMKWTKVSKSKADAYERFATAFFSCPGVEFHSLVVDTHKQKHAVYNDGNREIGFNKEIYQLCHKIRRLYGDGALHIYPDYRDTPQPLADLRRVLNNGANKKRDHRPWVFRRVHFVDSSKSLIMQLVDILTGSVAFRVNGRHDAPGASPAKCGLADTIMNRAGVRDASRDTAVNGKFTIWHRQLRK